MSKSDASMKTYEGVIHGYNKELYWKVKNGLYATDNSGAVTGWFLLAVTSPGVKDTYHAETQAGWIVLGAYCSELVEKDCLWVRAFDSEDDLYCFDYNSGDPWDKWACFLQDEAVRLAEKKGLVPEETTLLICNQEGFYGSEIQGAKND